MSKGRKMSPAEERPGEPTPVGAAPGNAPAPRPPDGDASRPPRTLTEEERLAAFRLAGEARSQLLAWVKWTFGFIVIVVSLLGIKGYSDWTSLLHAQGKDLDDKIRQQVDENLKANYKTRTDDVLDSSVKARAEIVASSRLVADLQKQS